VEAPSGERLRGKDPGLVESNGSLPPENEFKKVAWGLTACILGSAPGPKLGNEYGITFSSASYCHYYQSSEI